MGKNDCATKVFLSDRRVFADLVNFGVFGGKQVVEADDLRETDCEEVMSLARNDGGSSYKKCLRDMAMEVAMQTSDGTKYLVVGVENQNKPHLAMPARCLLYDAMRHAKNLQHIIADNERKHIATMDYISRLCPEDRLPPVITLVIYWGRAAGPVRVFCTR